MTFNVLDKLRSNVRNLEAQLQAAGHALEAADAAIEELMEENKELRKRITDATVILEGGGSGTVRRTA